MFWINILHWTLRKGAFGLQEIATDGRQNSSAPTVSNHGSMIRVEELVSEREVVGTAMQKKDHAFKPASWNARDACGSL